MDTCEEAKRIINRDGDICVKSNGDCTRLYWHISECEKCAILLEKSLGITKIVPFSE